MQRNLDNFIFVENPFTNGKQNQLLKLGFAQTVVLKIKKIRRFPREMAAPRMETNKGYL